jgi:hypothetical protein
MRPVSRGERAVGVVIVAASVASAPREASADEPSSTELDAVPIVGGDSDIGWGGGGVGAFTKFAPGPERRWAWQVQASVFLTFQGSPSFAVPYQDHWLQLMVPDLLGGRLRVQVRAAYTKESHIRYFGLGNAVAAPPNDNAPYYVYGRTHPILEGYARAALIGHFFVIAGGSFTVDWLDVPADGKLAADMATGSSVVRTLLDGDKNHTVGIVQGSVDWDSRDNEVAPRSGTWDELDVRISPALGTWMPYSYTEFLGIVRGYVALGDRVVVAGRLLGDVLLGGAPFYQLAEYQDTYAIGGTTGVRGVPAQRYYGKIKLLGNAEVRADIVRFTAVGKPWGIDLVGFFDAGRLWADWSLPDGNGAALDGTGLGLKWGTGLGVRVTQGTAFVVRGDVAWSPDAEPIAGYFAAGETF